MNSYLYQSAVRSSTPKQVLNQVEKKIMSTLNAVRARRRIFISIDGVAPVAKLDVQRSRRASKSSESLRSKMFDAQNFTPGCLFMGQLEEALKKMAMRYTHKQEHGFEFIISGASAKEEGEIKIAQEISMQHRIRGTRTSRAVITVDSDAFLQAFIHDIPSLFILNASDLKSGHVLAFSGEVMREDVSRLMPKITNTRQAQLDFALLSIFSGNDCVPSLPFGGVTYLWGTYVDYMNEAVNQPGLVDGGTLRINLDGLVAFVKYAQAARVDENTSRLLAAHRAQFEPGQLNTELMLDYLKSVQWSFSRLIGNPVSQMLSLFLSPRPPTFFDLASLDVKAAHPLFMAAFDVKENKLDRRKVPGAAAIMMLDPNSEASVNYIASPLRELFTAFHADTDCRLDDHERFKELCKTIMAVPRERFTPEEDAVTFPRLAEMINKKRMVWRPYDPPGPAGSKATDEEEGEQENVTSTKPTPLALTPCPTFMKLFGKKIATRQNAQSTLN